MLRQDRRAPKGRTTCFRPDHAISGMPIQGCAAESKSRLQATGSKSPQKNDPPPRRRSWERVLPAVVHSGESRGSLKKFMASDRAQRFMVVSARSRVLRPGRRESRPAVPGRNFAGAQEPDRRALSNKCAHGSNDRGCADGSEAPAVSPRVEVSGFIS